jgi:hypothetical protein
LDRAGVFGKGQKERLMPLRGPILEELHLLLSFDLPHVPRPPEGDDPEKYARIASVPRSEIASSVFV